MGSIEKVKSRWRKSYMELEENKEGNNNNNDSSKENDVNNISLNNHHHHSHHKHHHHHSSSHHHSHHHSSSKKHKQPQFEDLAENIYLHKRSDQTRNKKEARSMVCDCKLTKDERARGIMGCGEQCLNRMLMIECNSRCTLYDLCMNKRFQNKEYSKVEVFKTRKKGFGLRACTDIPAHTFIMEYVGEVVRSKEFRSRVKKYNKQKIRHHYFMALRNDEVIDATVKGNFTRFINHSCDPNCETQKWTIGGELRIGFFTIKNVAEGEEITFDYQFQRYGRKAQKCYCEAPSCRGYIGGNERTLSVNGDKDQEDGDDDDSQYDDDNNEDSKLNAGFRIPRLNRDQRLELEKKLDEEVVCEDFSEKIEKKNIFSTGDYFKTTTTSNSAAPAAPVVASSPRVFKRRFDSTTLANNIDLTPLPKISKEEHRQKFEMHVRMKDYYDRLNVNKISTLIELTNGGTSMSDGLASSLCDYDDYFTKRNEPLSINEVMEPCPGTYYYTPDGEIWFATVTISKQTYRPISVIYYLKYD